MSLRHSCTVERAEPIAAAICRSPKPSAFSRNTSRILRTGNLACPTANFLALRKIGRGSGWSIRFTSAGPASAEIRTADREFERGLLTDHAMSKKYLAVLELGFFALALFWFIPVIKSDASPYGYFPETAFVLVAMSISRALAYRNGRGPVLCAVEVAIVLVVFVAHRFALSIATGWDM